MKPPLPHPQTPPGWAGRLRPPRLARRIVATMLALLLGLQALVALFSGLDIRSYVARVKEEQLGFGEVALRDQLAAHGERLSTAASLAAKDHGLLDAVGDIAAAQGLATVEDALHNSLKRICLSELNQTRDEARVAACARQSKFAAVLGPDFATVAASGQPLPQPGRLAQQLVQQRAEQRAQRRLAAPGQAGPEAGGIEEITLVDGRLMQFVVARMPPQVPGWVIFGAQLDPVTLSAQVRERSNAELLMLARPVAAAAATPAAWAAPITSLGTEETAELLGRIGGARPDSALAGADSRFYTRQRQVGQIDSEVWAVLLLSRAQALAPFWQLLGSLLGITFVGVLLFGLGGRVIARRITTPLLQLAEHTHKFGEGNFHDAVPLPPLDDEVGTLARGLEQARQAIFRRDYVDAATGLPNARGLRGLLRQRAAGGQPFALLMVGIDRYDDITRTLGFQAGEALAAQLVPLLHAGGATPALGAAGTLGRWSHDRFAWLLPAEDLAAAEAEARAIVAGFGRRLALALPRAEGERDGSEPERPAVEVDVHLRVGLACWPAHAPAATPQAGDEQRIDAFILRADAALQAARETTRELMGWQPAENAAQARVEPLTLRTELQHAIADGQLRLLLQPKCAVRSGRLVAAEALVRWQHPQRGMVAPYAFIPFAEETGLVRELTRWVFAEVVRQWPALHAAGLQRVSVNLSMHDLLDPTLPHDLNRMLRSGPVPVPAAGICLEITESAVMKDPAQSLQMLAGLKEAGFKLSIDDFGEGQTSLRYLHDLPVDELKIDRALVKVVHQDRRSEEIVRFIIGLAHSLKLSVVAEGVEDDAVLDKLLALHCDEAQGFHPLLGRPAPAEELLARLRPAPGPATVAGRPAAVTLPG